MVLEDFIDIRLGDPISAMHLGAFGLALGTFIGRLTYYDFATRVEKVIYEHSLEAVRGLYIGPHSTLYVAIGDRHGVIVSDVSLASPDLHIVNYERQHSITDCPYQQTLMWKEVVCIVPVDMSDYGNFIQVEKELYTMNLGSLGMITTPGVRFRAYSVMYDFDGYRLLWLENSSPDTKTLKVTSVTPLKETSILQISFRRRITSAKLFPSEVLYVRDFRHIFLAEIENGSAREELGVAEANILAFDAFQTRQPTGSFMGEAKVVPIVEGPQESSFRLNSTSLVVITIDINAHIYLWNSRQQELLFDLTRLPELKKPLKASDLFSLGYPYHLQVNEHRIAVTTDVGVFLLHSERLQKLIDS
jgi:hypothetical protein